jgi:translation initiation factor IF-1
MEAVAVEKLDNLIAESQSDANLYPLDQPEVTVEIEVGDGDDAFTLGHRIKWPTTQALIEREQQTPQETEQLGASRNRVQTADGVMANAKLWDRFRNQVRGYSFGDVAPDEWVIVTPELAAEIPSEHKSEAVVAMFAAEFDVERPKGKGFVLGAQTFRVKQTYGPFMIVHIFNKPSEAERRELARKSRETQYQSGTAKVKGTIYTHLKPYVTLYDKLFAGLEGVTEGNSQRKDLVNAIWKQGAIGALMDYFDASRRDLKKS